MVSTSFSLNFTTVCCTLGPHGPYRVSQNYNRHTCEPFCSYKHWFSWISPVLCVRHWKPISHSYFTVGKTDLHSATDREENCRLKLELLMQAYSLLQRRDKKKKKVCSSGHILLGGGEISHTMQPWHTQANYDLKKYSAVTCRGEQSPSKFDTYSQQLKSAFGS